MTILPPPTLASLPAGTQLIAGNGVSTVVADFDFETYSPAGFIWDEVGQTWHAPKGANEKGLFAVGAAVYTQHPDAEVLSLAYDLKDGLGIRTWVPSSDYLPCDIFRYLDNGGLLEAFNVSFEKWVWENICVPKYGWPSLIPYYPQLRCAQAKARAFALPGSLDAVGKVLNIVNKKDADGKRLLNKFSIPQKPSKKQPNLRIHPHDDEADFAKLVNYNCRDIEAEAEVSSLIPDLSPDELEFWQCDQAINKRGVQIDVETIESCIALVEQVHTKYNDEFVKLTNNELVSASKIKKLQTWLVEYFDTNQIRINFESLSKDSIQKLIDEYNLPSNVQRILEIRLMLGSAAVKKPYAMQRQATREGRLHDLFLYHAARTGRATGAGPQPQNLPNHGPDVFLCKRKDGGGCGKYFGLAKSACPWCGSSFIPTPHEWGSYVAEQAIETINSRCLATVEYYWGDALPTISGSLRGLFIAAPGKRLISSDYSAIEAVVLAMLAKEQWRIDIFRTHGKIYEASASKITGIPLSEILNFYEANNKRHHPSRKLGKVAELASGYQGSLGAWIRFGALEQGMTEEEIQVSVKKWRAANPAIVNYWYGIERAAKAAMLNSGEHSYGGITYFKIGAVLYCRLLSGRCQVYQNAQLTAGKYGDQITYEGWNTNPDNGPIGWIRMSTYGGKLTENIVQAVARDILAHAIVNLEKSGCPVVLHIHDEIVSEVPQGIGSVMQFEQIMSKMPPWASDWPIYARGGWEGHRYRK